MDSKPNRPRNGARNSGREIEENNAWDPLAKWKSLVDDRIRSAIGDGDMSWHPKSGQPLDLNDLYGVPESERMATKIMKDNDAVPAWMALGFTLRDKHASIIERVQQYARDYVRRRENAIRKGSYVLQNHAEDRWQSALERLRVEVAKFNGELLNYNLQIPPQVDQMVPLNVDMLAARALKQAENAD